MFMATNMWKYSKKKLPKFWWNLENVQRAVFILEKAHGLAIIIPCLHVFGDWYIHVECLS